MMQSRWTALAGILLAALLSSPAWGSLPPQPGSINYIEGQASIGAHSITQEAVGTAQLGAGQSLTTKDGRAEILLAPGIFVRIDNRSNLQMVSPGLADTILTLQQGRALVEVAQLRPEND